ncbi:MAG: iron chelate uptake ABC transporter family permease subunit [Bacteriovoracaceae bacterium]|nr:iron chelate uptake ABC transporter family permease subunit [Bacteriovoracaceae bacterium]
MNYEIMRFVCAFFVGCFLFTAGNLTQTVTQNQLSSPSTLGFDGVVALIILICHLLITSLGISHSLEFVSSAVFLIVFALLVLGLKVKNNNKQDFAVYLSDILIMGVCFNLFVGGVFSLFYFFFLAKGLEFPSQLWFGNFKFVNFFYLCFLALVFVAGLIYLKTHLKKLSALNYGNDFSWNMGINPVPVIRRALLAAFLLSGVSYCFFGVFSFLGLLFPFFIRSLPYFRGDLGRQFYVGSLVCGFFLAFLDNAVFHLTFYGAEIPVGILSTFLGPLLMILIIAVQKQSENVAKAPKNH